MLHSQGQLDAPRLRCSLPIPLQGAHTPGSQDASESMLLDKVLNLGYLTAIEASQLMRSGRMSVQHYILGILRHIRNRDASINAWVYLDESHAIKQARELDGLEPDSRGPLHGVAVGIKDIIAVRDMPTRYGSAMHEQDDCFPTDAAVVSILRSAGAVILGKTATTEFAATSQGGPCANPQDIQRTPGGSSSGSAAAVADYHVPITIGTQTGGSIIRPGSFTGTFAFKPTWGMLSTEGVGRFSITCDTLGVYARDVEDLVLLSRLFGIQLNCRSVPRALSTNNYRVAFVRTPMWSKAGTGTQKAWQQAELLLKRAGADITHLDLPDAFNNCCDWREIILSSEARAAFLPRYIQAREQLHPSIRIYVEDESLPKPHTLCEAYDGISLLRTQWDRIAGDFDFVLAPSAPDEAPLGLQYTGSSAFNYMWTILHVPVLNVPGLVGQHGLPIGLTVTGPRYSDASVLEAGKIVAELFKYTTS